MAGLSYFHNLDVKGDKAAVRRQCAKHLLIQVFDKDEVVIRKGDVPTGFFIMLEGSIMLNQNHDMNDLLLSFDRPAYDYDEKSPFRCLKK